MDNFYRASAASRRIFDGGIYLHIAKRRISVASLRSFIFIRCRQSCYSEFYFLVLVVAMYSMDIAIILRLKVHKSVDNMEFGSSFLLKIKILNQKALCFNLCCKFHLKQWLKFVLNVNS